MKKINTIQNTVLSQPNGQYLATLFNARNLNIFAFPNAWLQNMHKIKIWLMARTYVIVTYSSHYYCHPLKKISPKSLSVAQHGVISKGVTLTN